MNKEKKMGEHKKTRRLLMKLANKGDSNAQYQLSQIYYYGTNGVTRDLQKAKQLMEKAAENGNVEAQYLLGTLYEEGKEFEQDSRKAFYWYSMADKKGHLEAHYKTLRLDCIQNGDIETEISVLKHLSNLGMVKAQYELGVIYLDGKITKMNTKKAHHLLLQSAQKDYDLSYMKLGFMYLTGTGVDTDEKKGYMYYEKAANLGNIEAKFTVASMYYSGTGVEQDLDLATKLFNQIHRDEKDSESIKKTSEEIAKELIADEHKNTSRKRNKPTKRSSPHSNKTDSCAICLERPRNTAIIPCGHTFCDSCISLLSNCSFCRGNILQSIKIFL